jgi:hypothetical protein
MTSVISIFIIPGIGLSVTEYLMKGGYMVSHDDNGGGDDDDDDDAL